MTKPFKRTIVFDFDGVIHSYRSGWKGPRNIPDPPVPGMIQYLYKLVHTPDVEVCIYSSRSKYWGGRRAMKKWLKHYAGDVTWYDGLESIKFPLFKPAAFVTIDDRAITFTGEMPSIEELLRFKPWNKK